MFLSNKSADFNFFIIIISSIFIPFLIHIILVRLCGLFKNPFARQKGIAVSSLLGLVPLEALFLLWAVNVETKTAYQLLWSGLYLFSVYISFSYIYFHIFNLSETGRRIRILAEIYKKGFLKKDDLVKKYTCQDMMSNRLKRLIALGGLRFVKERYVVGNKIFLLTARIIFSFRTIPFPSKKSDSKSL
jgi:hypothetical protein